MSSYDIEKFDPPPDPELVCCICTFVLDQPMESPCQHVFCKHCIETWLQQRRNCPTCRKKMSKRHLKPVLPLVQNMLNKLAMICDFRDNGCQEKPTLELYRSHIAKCEFEMMTCKFKDCQAPILRRDIAVHETNLCEFREVLCLRQCGLHIPIKDIDNHDCMLALKKHAEERQKHAEELEARLQSLMSLQQSLREDVDKLRRQVEEERQRREEQEAWSPSFQSTPSWDSTDDENGEHTTAEILDSDSDTDSDHTLQSDGHNRSRDLSDSDLEYSNVRRPPRPLSVSSNNTDDVEIVGPPVPGVIESEIIEENVDSVPNTETPTNESPVDDMRQTESTFEIVSGTSTSTSLQNTSEGSQSTEQLLQQIIDCCNGLGDLNLSNSTWELVCKYLTEVMCTLMRAKQMFRNVSTAPQSSTPLQGDRTDTSDMLMHNTESELTASVVTESDIFASTTQQSDISGQTGEMFDTWSATDSSNDTSMQAHQNSLLQRLLEWDHRPKTACSFKDQPSTSANDDHVVDTEAEEIPLKLSSNIFRSDDLDELLATASPNRASEKTNHCDETCVCLSSIDEPAEANGSEAKPLHQTEDSDGVYVDIAVEEDELTIPSTFQQHCQEDLNPGCGFDQTRKHETVKRKHPSSDISSEQQKKMRKQLLESKDNDFTYRNSMMNSQLDPWEGPMSRLCSKGPKSQNRFFPSTVPKHHPVSCTVTSASAARSDVIPNRNTTNVVPNPPKENHSLETEPVGLPVQTVRHGRRIHFPEPPGQPREIVDVPVPPGTAQLLVEYNGDSDSSWEPGNSDVEGETEEISSSEDEESDNSY